MSEINWNEIIPPGSSILSAASKARLNAMALRLAEVEMMMESLSARTRMPIRFQQGGKGGGVIPIIVGTSASILGATWRWTYAWRTARPATGFDWEPIPVDDTGADSSDADGNTVAVNLTEQLNTGLEAVHGHDLTDPDINIVVLPIPECTPTWMMVRTDQNGDKRFAFKEPNAFSITCNVP